tara:strand:- start:804 stop:920 length:117 start_codon:yes stop_codon:yes gene_type:complete
MENQTRKEKTMEDYTEELLEILNEDYDDDDFFDDATEM